MANPSQKAPGINKFLSGIAGRDREQTIKNDKCMTCGGEASNCPPNHKLLTDSWISHRFSPPRAKF